MMEIVYKKVSDLVPYENNPRNNDNAVDYVAESIKNFGFKVPIIIDKDNVVVTGHTRLKASEKLGLDKVPCIMADDLTEEQIKAYRLADNKVAEYSTWDLDKLDMELEDLKDFNMSDFGFDTDDEDFNFIDDLEESEGLVDKDNNGKAYACTFTFFEDEVDIVKSKLDDKESKEEIKNMILDYCRGN